MRSRSWFRVLTFLSLAGVLAALAGAASVRAAGGVAFGPVFQLNNPSNPFVFGVQDVEPSVRTDGLGNVYVSAIRGVPAGVDAWRVRAPFTSSSYAYLGSPDGLPKIPGGGPSGEDEDTGVATGGGDTDLVTNCSTNLLNLNSLNIATTENFRSDDQGATFLQTEPSSSTFSGADDREWYDSDGPTVVYQSVHDVALGNDTVVTKSLDGGLTWLPVPGKVNGGDSVWNVFMAQSLNAHVATPTFTTTQITGINGIDPIHRGNVSTGGLQPGGTADRSLADLFQVSIGPDGLANISWTANWTSEAGLAWFVHQTTGALGGVPNDGCHSFAGGPVGGAAEAKTFGSGRINGASGGSAAFGFSLAATGQGALTVVDKGAGVTKFSAGTFSPPTGTSGTATWAGTGTLTRADGSTQSLPYKVRVVDGGPRGRGDTFSISFGSYSNSGPVKGGDITVH